MNIGFNSIVYCFRLSYELHLIFQEIWFLRSLRLLQVTLGLSCITLSKVSIVAQTMLCWYEAQLFSWHCWEQRPHLWFRGGFLLSAGFWVSTRMLGNRIHCFQDRGAWLRKQPHVCSVATLSLSFVFHLYFHPPPPRPVFPDETLVVRLTPGGAASIPKGWALLRGSSFCCGEPHTKC